jgi:predicted transcriptional regulator of viral defense system
MDVDEAIDRFDKNGVITSSDITKYGVHRSILRKLTESGRYYRVARGIYIRNDEWEDEFYLLQKKYSRGVFSHATALYLHGYSDRVPLKFQMTFPKGYNSSSLNKENVEICRVIPENYNLGIVEVKTPGGNIVKAYDLERCLCDMLRGKGDDIQLVQSAIKRYVLSKERDINKLLHYAKQLRVEPKVKKYLEVLL